MVQSSLLVLLRQDTVPPKRHTMKHLSPFISAIGTNARSNTGLQDNCVILDTPWMPYLSKLVTVLTTGKPNETLWSFFYFSLYHEVKALRKMFGPGRQGQSFPNRRWTKLSMSSVLRYDKFAADYQAILVRARLEIERTARRLAVCVSLWQPLRRCTHNRMHGVIHG